MSYDSRNCGRVDAAEEVDSHRDIGAQAQADGVEQMLPDACNDLRLGSRLDLMLGR
jgi:hypothetical protein